LGRKRRQLSKIFGFKEGNALSHKDKKLEYEQNSSSEPFMRLKGAVFGYDVYFFQNVRECLVFIEDQTFIENLSYLINNSHLLDPPLKII
jgi:hypothetical protein